ncbi:hypothetical protein D3C86_1956430 [compost metagenome]
MPVAVAEPAFRSAWAKANQPLLADTFRIGPCCLITSQQVLQVPAFDTICRHCPGKSSVSALAASGHRTTTTAIKAPTNRRNVPAGDENLICSNPVDTRAEASVCLDAG